MAQLAELTGDLSDERLQVQHKFAENFTLWHTPYFGHALIGHNQIINIKQATFLFAVKCNYS